MVAHGAAVTGTAAKNMANQEGRIQASSGKYNDVPNPKNVGEGKATTSSQRKNILNENKRQNIWRIKK